ncbi:MAG: hypothetical protein ABEJ93_01550 [Candidatus Nanohalobium sp.]
MALSKITPLGRSDDLVRKHVKEMEGEEAEKYEKALNRYRVSKFLRFAVKILLYAGIVTSITATLGFETKIIAKLSSYIGVTALFIFYTFFSYLTLVNREEYHVRREILLNSTVVRQEQ